MSSAFFAGWAARVRVALLVAASAFVIDHVTKLMASQLSTDYVQNDLPTDFVWWVPLALFLIGTLVPSMWTAVFAGLALGGGLANIVDSVAWPGGVVDFIDIRHSRYNLADLFIAIGLAGLALSIAVVTIHHIARRSRLSHS